MVGVLGFWADSPGRAEPALSVGELNSYKSQPAFLEPYKKGMDLAVEEINAAGGVLGKSFAVISRDAYMQVAMLMPDIVAAHKQRWALVYPNFEYGQSAVAAFKQLLQAKQPNVAFVTEQAPPLGKIDAGAVAQAIDDAKPDAIFNVLFGPDLAKLVREGNVRGVFRDRFVASLLSGEPEYLDPLKDEAPVGWLVTGYPWYGITTPEHKRFLGAYEQRFHDYPRLGSVVGYLTAKSLAAGITKAGTTAADSLPPSAA